MTTTTRAYYVSLDGGAEISCESLGLAPQAISRANLAVDTLTLEQRRVRGQWAAHLAHDLPVRFYRLKEDDTLEQLFMGRVVAPVDAVDASASRKLLRVNSVMQFALESLFHRGAWTADSPSGVGNFDPEQSGDECSLYWGSNYLKTGPTSFAKRTGRQRVDQAVAEWADNLIRLAKRSAQPAVWRPFLASNTFGPTSQVPQAEWTLQGSTTYLDWLVRCLQPVPDAFCAWDYAVNQPTARIGRYRDQEPVDLVSGWPTLAQAIRRDIDKEASRLFVFWRFGEPSTESPPSQGRVRRRLRGRYPLTSPVTVFDRRAKVMTFDFPQASGEAAIPPDPATLADFVGDTVTAPMLQGSVTLMGGAWRYCQPGSVIQVGDHRLNVQTTVLDLTTEALTATLGVPQHLGVQDLQDMARWLRRWERRA